VNSAGSHDAVSPISYLNKINAADADPVLYGGSPETVFESNESDCK